MKNKGFTLVELIVTITLMVMIGLVIGTNMLGIFSSEEDKDYENFVKEYTDSACMYVEVNLSSTDRAKCKTNGCVVTLDDLIKEGYIDEAQKDPSTGELLTKNKDKYTVNVKWINNEKKCTLNS